MVPAVVHEILLYKAGLRQHKKNDYVGSGQPNPVGNKTAERISNLPSQISCQER